MISRSRTAEPASRRDFATASAGSTRDRLYQQLVPCVRLILAVELIVNGLNWWVKLIGPYPSISDFSGGRPVPADMVGAMIATGFIFHLVKAIEIVAGIGLLLNRWVPLCLVLSFPVTVNVFLVDVFISHKLRSHVMGGGLMLMSLFLMLAYFSHYAPMLGARTQPDPVPVPIESPHSLRFVRMQPFRQALLALGVLSALWGAVMLVWVGAMSFQHFSGQP